MSQQTADLHAGGIGIPQSIRYHSIVKNWKYSTGLLDDLRSVLAKELNGFQGTIAVAGSLGRLEASEESDIDFIIIGDNDDEALKIRNKVVAEIERRGLSTPKRDGVFSAHSTPGNLLLGVGDAEENLGPLSRRILLMLESKPLFNTAGYEKIIESVFEKYCTDVIKESHKQFAFLMNDLIRYFRSICVNYQSTFWRENEKWPLRNIKLRHSRVVMYAGMLCILGTTSSMDSKRKVKFLKDSLQLTPLERISKSYDESCDDGFSRVAGPYEIFLSAMSDKVRRAELRQIDYDERYNHSSFSHLKSNSDALIAELMRYIFSQKGKWSDRFFEYLLF